MYHLIHHAAQKFCWPVTTPFIIMGDFNGHNPLWGSKTTNGKGKKLEDFISQEGLCIFNDGTDTYLHPGNWVLFSYWSYCCWSISSFRFFMESPWWSLRVYIMFLPLSCRNTQECADIKERRSIPAERHLLSKFGWMVLHWPNSDLYTGFVA